MKWRTEISVPRSPVALEYTHKIALLGSCFADRIGHLLLKKGWDAMINPLGIAYHPLSIFQSLEWLTENQFSSPHSFFQHEGVWKHFDLHSSMARADKGTTLSHLKQTIGQGHEAICKTDIVILTLGTAWVYGLKEGDFLVNNCHKQNGTLFAKRLLTTKEIVASGIRSLRRLKSLRPDIQVIFTVSPVRHIKNGLADNMRSKTCLLQAIYTLMDTEPNVHYFPSFEIMVDDLRDYRFYEGDLIHPNEVALEYIYGWFRDTWMSREAWEIEKRIDQLHTLRNHRPLNPDTEESRALGEKIIEEKKALVHTFPFLKNRL